MRSGLKWRSFRVTLSIFLTGEEMLSSKREVRAFAITAVLWHCLKWYATADTGPQDADYRLFSPTMFVVHALQVFVILLIYSVTVGDESEDGWR